MWQRRKLSAIAVIIVIFYRYKMLWTPRLQGTSILISKYGKIANVFITKTVHMGCQEWLNQSHGCGMNILRKKAQPSKRITKQ